MPVKPAVPVVIRGIRVFLYLSMANGFCLLAAYAQTEKVFGVIQSSGVQEPYGINDLNILSNQTAASADYAYATRHRRRGQATGIGGSYIGTTSVTVETTAPEIPNIMPPVVHNEATMVNQSLSSYGNVAKTPALYGSLTKQYFDINVGNGLQRSIISPAFRAAPLPSWAATGKPLVKRPTIIIEPVENINLHRTGGVTSSPY